jgi:hypothetical protein
MTKQIGRAYRRNRRSSWLLAALVVLFAVAAIPIANGHGPSTGTIGGKVWQDTDENGVVGAASLEPGQQFFRVNLYAKVVGNLYLPVQWKTPDVNGDYTFANVPFGPSYLVCEQLLTGASWSQTIPLVQTKPCGTVPINKPNGYAFSFTASVTGLNFGNVQSVALDSTSGCGSGNFGGGSAVVTPGFEYEARLTLPAGTTTCKTGTLVMLTYANGSTRVATLHPPAGVSGAKYPVVERFKWTHIAGTVPITLSYDDTGPTYGDVPVPMPMCIRDPRSPAGTGYVLGSNLDNVLPGSDTSCIISREQHTAVDPADGGTYEAYVFSSVDGWKSG